MCDPGLLRPGFVAGTLWGRDQETEEQKDPWRRPIRKPPRGFSWGGLGDNPIGSSSINEIKDSQTGPKIYLLEIRTCHSVEPSFLPRF